MLDSDDDLDTLPDDDADGALAVREAILKAHEKGVLAGQRAALSELFASIGREFVSRFAPGVTKSFDESKHPRDHGKFASHPGASGTTADKPEPSSSLTDPAEHPADAKARSLLAHVAKVPRAVRERVSSFIQKQYAKLSAKYGETGAKAVLGGMLLLLPAPVPGSSLIPVAIAEAVQRTRKALRGSVNKADDGHDMTPDEIEAAAREALAELYGALGEELPPADGEPEPSSPAPRPHGAHAADHPPDPHAALLLAALDHRIRQLDTGEDDDGGHVLLSLWDDPDALADLLAPRTADEPAVTKAVTWAIFKAWDESKHPRNKRGNWISREAIHEAKTDPAKAEKLREEVKPEDAQKLESALEGKTDTGRTQKGLRREAVAAKRARQTQSRSAAKKLASDLMLEPKAATPQQFRKLAELIQGGDMRAEELRDIRIKLAASFGGGRKTAEMVKALLEHVEKNAQTLEGKLEAEPQATAEAPAEPASLPAEEAVLSVKTLPREDAAKKRYDAEREGEGSPRRWDQVVGDLRAAGGTDKDVQDLIDTYAGPVKSEAKPSSVPPPSRSSADTPAARKATIALDAVRSAAATASTEELTRLYGRALAANADLPESDRAAHLAQLRAAVGATEADAKGETAPTESVPDESDAEPAPPPGAPLLSEADKAVASKRRAKAKKPAAAAPVEEAVPQSASPPSREPHELTKGDFESSAMNGRESAEKLDNIRAGDKRSKNAGDLRRVNAERPHVHVNLPLDSLSPEEIKHLRESTDPERVKQYVGENIDTPVHATPKRRGNGFQINDGGHRLVAAIDRGDKTIPAMVPADSHKALVAAALASGKPVPPEVLADYPDLATKYGGTAGAPNPVSPPPAPKLSARSFEGRADDHAPTDDEFAAASRPATPRPAPVPHSENIPVDNSPRVGDTSPVPSAPGGAAPGGKTMTPSEHRHADKSGAALSDALINEQKASERGEDPRGYRSGPPKGLDMPAFTRDVAKALTDNAAAGGAGMRPEALHAALKAKYPNLSLDDFQRAAFQLFDDRSVAHPVGEPHGIDSAHLTDENRRGLIPYGSKLIGALRAGPDAARVAAEPRPATLDMNDPKALAAAVHAAGQSVPSFNGRPFVADNSTWNRHPVLIGTLYDHMARTGALPPGTTLDQFKRALFRAHQSGALNLSRNDLPQVVAPDQFHQIARGEIQHPLGGSGATMHKVDIPTTVPTASVAPQPAAPHAEPVPAAAPVKAKGGAKPATRSKVNPTELASSLTALRDRAATDRHVPASEFRAEASRHLDGLGLTALNNLWKAMGGPNKFTNPQMARERIVNSVMSDRTVLDRVEV